MIDHGLFVEKYRPKTIEDCILPQTLKNTLLGIVKSGQSQNLLLHGGAGVGKTTVARAICSELDADSILINCSEEGNIDTLRTRIRQFASTVSLNGGNKIVILDEFDYSNAQSIQPALRGAIEEFSKNCRFIITCNYKNRIISPIHSRCTNIEFAIPSKEKPGIAGQVLSRLEVILSSENIPYEKSVLVSLITKYFPDIRRILNELQRYSVSGLIDVGILSSIGELQVKDLISSMKNRDFVSCRKWVVENIDNSQTELFRKIYDGLNVHMKSSSIPQAILTIAEYQYKSAFVADQEINLTACIVELMMECEFK
jgi:DNA polymerase III delta prime subunit